uniref:Little elongation complex subunit 1 C-terminal domain-containing protein n=2 Tax=Myripristis murdjan TaxID=586833 RepID=A0A668AJR4_9TELE
MDKLKEENSKTVTQNKKLEDQIKDMEALTEKQTLENAQLKREKVSLEVDLQKTQEYMKTSQALAEQVAKLREENAKTVIIKTTLENQLRHLEESSHKQSHQISQLMREKALLERNMHDLQVRLLRLERERSKEYRSSSTQATVPEEPKVDKEKVRLLLKNLWDCVAPQQPLSANTLNLPEACSNQPFQASSENRLHSQQVKCDWSHSASQRFHESQYNPNQSKETLPTLPMSTARVHKAIEVQASLQCTSDMRQTDSTNKQWKACVMEDSSTVLDIDLDIKEILMMFKPLPPCLSPVPDLCIEVDSLEKEDMETESQLKHTNESTSILPTSKSSHDPDSCRLAADQTVDLAVGRTQNMEDISSEDNSEHFRHHESTGISEMKPKRDSADTAEITNVEDTGTEQVPKTAQLPLSSKSSSASDRTLLVEVASIATESEGPQCTSDPTSSLSVNTCILKTPLFHTEDSGGVSVEHTQGEAGEDESAGISKMDVVANTCDATAAGVMTSIGGESQRQKNNDVASEAVPDTLSVISTTSTGFIQDSEVTNGKHAAVGETCQDSSDLGLGSQDTMEMVCRSQETEVKETLGEDTDVLEDQPWLSGVAVRNSVSGVSAKKLKERDGDDATTKCHGEALEAESEEKPASSVESNNDKASGKLSLHKSVVFKMVDKGETLTDQESGNANHASTNDFYTKTLDNAAIAEHSGNGISLCESQEIIQTAGCESMERSVHPLSSASLLPTVKQEPSKLLIQPEKGNIDVSLTKSKQLTTNVKTLEPVTKSVDESAEGKDVLIDPRKARLNSGDKKVSTDTRLDLLACSHPIVSPTDPLKQGAATTNGPIKSGYSCEELSPHMTREKVSLRSSAAGLPAATVAQQPLIGQVRSEMGPPLPPLLAPLSATPPKVHKPVNPRQAIEKLSFPSPMDRLASPTTTPVQAHMTCHTQKQNSPSQRSPLPPSGVPSSPLQFGSATPKHAVPVPGRLPLSALNSSSSSSSPSQENSMRMLDTMYPELSARARTLSILRGNVGTTPTTTVGQISGFKTITSSSTAFTKTELRGDKTEQKGEKRPAIGLPQPKNNKWLRLDSSSSSHMHKVLPSSTTASADESTSVQSSSPEGFKNEMASQSVEPAEKTVIAKSLEKIQKQCFDLLPVIKSHLYVGNLSKKPVLRDEEKEVISKICQSSSDIADDMILAILSELKTQRGALSGNYMQALCRVHTGICRQKNDWEKAHILAYSILREDLPDPAKLILFMVTTWPKILSHGGGLCQAIQTVTRLKAQGEVLNCLARYLGWEKNPPCDIDQLIFSTVSEIRAGSGLSFTKHSRYGDDLGTKAWELVFTLELLCTHKTWSWTYENLLGKELWPLMNTWVSQGRDQQTPISHVTVATVLRLIGRLSQRGIKQRCGSSVVTVANIMNTFGRHGHAEGVPWEVQLAAIYCIYDLSPCNPKQALDAIAGWRGETTGMVPLAITSCINQIACVCRQVKS